MVPAAAAGSYHQPYTAEDSYYDAGYRGGPGSTEARNFFVFDVPEFSAPLAAAELRLYAGGVDTPSSAIPFELHSVEAHPALVAMHSPDYKLIFDDLGDGQVLGRRDILRAEGSVGFAWDRGALIQVPLNAAGIDELNQKQGGQIALGGVVPSSAQRSLPVMAFDYSLPATHRVQLVLYFSNSGPVEITGVNPSLSGEVLATDRFNLAATVCGKAPLVRQWFRNGEPLQNATNDVLEIRSMRQADAGTYSMVASNEFGIQAAEIATLDFAPLYVSPDPQAIFLGTGELLTIYFGFATRLPTTYQWRKDGTNVAGQNGPQFLISRAAVSDSGDYDIVMSNSAGSRTSGVATVTVGVRPPRFENDSVDARIIPVGASLEMSKTVTGDLPIYYQWYRDGQAVPGANTNYLRINSAGFSDAGVYELVAANAATSATSEVFQVTVVPFFIYNDFDQEALWLNPFNFYTFVDTFFPVSVQWYFNDEPIPDGTNMPLGFAAVDFTNAGLYFLIASNAYGVLTSVVFTLTVITDAPSAFIYPEAWQGWMGEDATLRGNTSGGPPPTLQWFLNDILIPGATTETLDLKSVSTNQSGNYTLVASNEFGTATARSFVNVIAEAPFFSQLPGKSNVLTGDYVTVRAKAVGGPPPTYQWRRNGVDLPGATNNSLLLGTVNVADSGAYEIVARNEFGEARYTHVLHVSAPTGLDRWTWRLPQAQGSRLYDAALGNGSYVAVGKAGNIITSTDSVHWTSMTVDTDDLRPVAFGNGLFVTVGEQYDPMVLTNWEKFPLGDYYRYTLSSYLTAVLVSSNGLDWEFGVNPDSERLTRIVFGNGVFVATSYYVPYFCYTSVDGRHWVGRNVSGLRAYEVLFGNGRFLAVGSDGFVYYSKNGEDWTNSGVNKVTPLFFGNGRFIAFGSGGNMEESTDGVAWQVIGLISGILPQTFAGGGGRFVGGLTTPGYASYSSDAAHWTAVDTGTRQEIERIIYADGQFLAVGEAGTISRSVDGQTWTSDEVANKIDFYGTTDGNGLRVIAGDAGTILTSSNGLGWDRQNTPTTRNLHAVAYGAGLFVAGGRGGELMTSPDGVSWTVRESRTTNYIERIGWANGLWVAVTEGGHVTTSSNGVEWALVNYHFNSTDHEGVAYGNGLWLVAGGYFDNHNRAVDTVFTSPDAGTWTRQYANAGKRWRDVAFGKGKFVAVGNDGAMSYSTNGSTWSVVSFITRENLRRVQYANGRFIAIGNNGALLSSMDPANGLPWTTHRSHSSQNLHDIHLGRDGTFVFVGNNGMVLQSGDTRPRFLTVGRDGRLEFDSGIAGTLRLERSPDLRTWETEAADVTSPYAAPIGAGSKFWRLAGE